MLGRWLRNERHQLASISTHLVLLWTGQDAWVPRPNGSFGTRPRPNAAMGEYEELVVSILSKLTLFRSTVNCNNRHRNWASRVSISLPTSITTTYTTTFQPGRGSKSDKKPSKSNRISRISKTIREKIDTNSLPTKINIPAETPQPKAIAILTRKSSTRRTEACRRMRPAQGAIIRMTETCHMCKTTTEPTMQIHIRHAIKRTQMPHVLVMRHRVGLGMKSLYV